MGRGRRPDWDWLAVGLELFQIHVSPHYKKSEVAQIFCTSFVGHLQ